MRYVRFLLLNHFFIFTFLQSLQPHQVKRSDFKCGVETSGRFKGCRYVEGAPNIRNTKTEALSLKKTKFNTTEKIHRYHEDVDDKYDFVRIFHHYNENLLPPIGSDLYPMGHGDRFFRRRAPEKELRQRRRNGVTFEAGLKPAQLMGVNAFTKLMKQVAVECCLDHPENQGSASLRSEGICTIVNAAESINQSAAMAFSRHVTASAHASYKRDSQTQLDKISEAFKQEKKPRTNPINNVSFRFYVYELLKSSSHY